MSRSAKRLTIIVGEQDMIGHRSAAIEIVHRAHEHGLSGASVFRGIEGFGSSSRIHTSRLLSLSNDLPVCVVIVDEDDLVDSFVEEVSTILQSGLVTVETIEVIDLGATSTP